MNRNIIIVLIIIVLIALVGIFAFTQFTGKADTQINFISQATLKNGDQVQFELKDAQGNALPNQKVSISFEGNGHSQTFDIVTDSQGKGGLRLNNENPGNYNITVKYDGDEKHKESSASQMITIKESTVDADSVEPIAETSSNEAQTTSSSESNLHHDSELNVEYNDNGKIVGGQNDGADYEYIKNNPQQVDAEGNLV